MTRTIMCILFNGLIVYSAVGNNTNELNIKMCEYIESVVEDNSEVTYEYTDGEEADCFSKKCLIHANDKTFVGYISSMIENAGKYTIICVGNDGWGLYDNINKKLAGYTTNVNIRNSWQRNC